MPTSRESVCQFDLRSMLVVMAFFAVTGAAIGSGAFAWNYLFDLLVIGLFGGGIVATVASSGSQRVFWLALVVFMTLVLLLDRGELKFLGIQRELPLSSWIRDLVGMIHPELPIGGHFTNVPMTMPSGRGYTALTIGLKASAITIGFIAAYISRAVYLLAERRGADAKLPLERTIR